MVEMTKKFVEKVDKFVGTIMFKCLDSDFIGNLDDEELKMIRDMYAFMDSSKELIIRQAEVMDEQNKKLDMLLELASKKD